MKTEYSCHPVCTICKHPCKKKYSSWNWLLSPLEFCKKFEEDRDEYFDLPRFSHQCIPIYCPFCGNADPRPLYVVVNPHTGWAQHLFKCLKCGAEFLG